MKQIFKLSVLLLCLTLVVAASNAPTGYKVGDTIEDFALKNVDGEKVSLADYASSKGVILIFDCNTCPYSKRYNKRILALDKDFAPKGFPVIAINANDPEVSPGDSFDKMVSHASDKGYTFPYLYDETQEVAKAFGATNTPHVFLLQQHEEGWQVAYIGAIDDNARDASDVEKQYVEDAIQAILNNETVPVTKTKAIGCTIKWKRA